MDHGMEWNAPHGPEASPQLTVTVCVSQSIVTANLCETRQVCAWHAWKPIHTNMPAIACGAVPRHASDLV